MVCQLIPSSLLVLLFSVQINAECCDTVSKSGCADGTLGTPCCGVGNCNIFCCRCEGGCRRNKWPSFEDGESGVKWKFDCDYPGYDIKNYVARGEDCGQLCIDNQSRGCNAFSHHGRKCHLKSLPHFLDESPASELGQWNTCGFLPWVFVWSE